MSEELKSIITIPKPDLGIVFIDCPQGPPNSDPSHHLKQMFKSECRKGLLTKYGKKLLEEGGNFYKKNKDENR